jgi:hypothetical protein
MSSRHVLLTAGIAVAVGLPSLAALTPSTAAAAPGGDAFVVVSTFTIPSADVQATSSVMCPSGARALGGGAAPTAPNPGGVQFLRTFYTAPLDASGLASQTDAGDVPRGWMVSVGHDSGVQDDVYKLFVVCSATSDAVLASATLAPASPLEATVPCPAGMRATGGGVGKNGDTAIPGNTQGPYVDQTGPVDSTGTVAGTSDGDVPTGWRTVSHQSSFGNRFFAVCSAQSDAVVRVASYSVATVTQVGSATVTCPAGTRVLSGGDQVDGTVDGGDDRLGRQGPVGALTEVAQVSTGSVARSWTASGRGNPTGARNHRVYAVCATDVVVPPPADTTPPQTTIGTGPKKKTTSTKATVAFSSEAGAAFTCQLDKKQAAACTSPFKVKKLKPGKHKLTVTAKDAAGNADPSPAVFKWKVLKKKPKPHHPSGCTGECRSAATSGYPT